MAISARAAQFHEGFDSDSMECHRQEDFSETSEVHKGEFRNFLNLGVAKVLRRACQPVHVSTFLSWDQKWMRAAHFLDMFAAEVFHLEATAVDRYWFSLPRRGLKALCGKFSGLGLNCGGPSL